MRVLASIAIGIAVCAGVPARADRDDDATETPPDDSELILDPLFLPPPLEGLAGADAEREGVTLPMGRRTLARLEGSWWQNEDSALTGTRFRDAAIDVPALGWSVSAELVHDVGWAELVLGTSLSAIESRYGRGKYLTAGVGLRKRWKLSRFTTIWLMLGAGMQSWLGEPPPGQRSSTVMGLTVGGTFR
jgi:hypothetical protein